MTAATQFIDATVSRHIGTYSDAVAIPACAPQVVLSGTPGLRPDGTRPGDFAEEAGQASDNVCEALRCAGAEPSDIVQVWSWLTARGDIDAYVKVRKDVISHRPAYMLAVVPQLIRLSLRWESEVTTVVTHSAAEQHE
ncbi:Rid family hydrolase [Streptomyces mirabilis]|uniref:Rid family hydrolase n=1 Tax=Streptomyces mirabilis TaxID=68239 RepID=A0ABU3V6Q9_9ACTN|nr:Rid family hydrolase [Streptomyces mirabilis]MDU9001851.1 Rid family hydrolase [Streptomyces mirabilis]